MRKVSRRGKKSIAAGRARRGAKTKRCDATLGDSRGRSVRACCSRHGLVEFMMILLKFKTQDSFPDSSAVTKRQSGEFAHRSEEPGLDTRGTRADKNSGGPKSVGHTKHGSVRAASDCLMPDYSRCSARLALAS